MEILPFFGRSLAEREGNGSTFLEDGHGRRGATCSKVVVAV
jgi:hypothetical protein